MIKQKSLSLRLDYDAYVILQQECFITGLSRNRLINRAAWVYCGMMRLQRDFLQGNVTETQFNHECHRLLSLFSTPIV